MKFLDFFTDAKGRGEIKVLVGLISIVGAFALSVLWLFTKGDVGQSLAIFGAFAGYGGGLLGIAAAADSKIDAATPSFVTTGLAHTLDIKRSGETNSATTEGA